MPSRHVMRSFAFVDMCGFTAYMDAHGDEEAVRALSALRSVARPAAEEHGVRIGKWLGDGAMLVGMEHDPVLACVLKIRERLPAGSQPPVRGGVASGPVVLFEGDDYVGWATNIAARLCSVARPRQILVARHVEDERDWDATEAIRVRGFSRSIPVQRYDATG